MRNIFIRFYTENTKLRNKFLHILPWIYALLIIYFYNLWTIIFQIQSVGQNHEDVCEDESVYMGTLLIASNQLLYVHGTFLNVAEMINLAD